MIKTIETIYKGYRFRSRLEARWAVFFNALKISWEYEKEGYMVDNKYYLPDFYLNDVYQRSSEGDGCFVEIKPINYDIMHNEDDSNKYHGVAQFTEKALILFLGLPMEPNENGYGFEYSGQGWDNYMIFCKCYNCGKIKIEFMEGNYMYCPICESNCDDHHPDLVNAAAKAKQARFEYGENGL